MQDSLQWETFEQVCLWDLLSAEFCSRRLSLVSSHVACPTLPVIAGGRHPEALNGLQSLLCRALPDAQVVPALVCAPQGVKQLALLVLLHWTRTQPVRLAEALRIMLTSVHAGLMHPTHRALALGDAELVIQTVGAISSTAARMKVCTTYPWSFERGRGGRM